MGEGLPGDVEASLADVEIGGIKVVFHDGTDVCLNQEGILAQFFELVAFVFQIAAVLILGINTSRVVWFFCQDIAHVIVVEFICLTGAMCFGAGTSCQGFKQTVQLGAGYWMRYGNGCLGGAFVCDRSSGFMGACDGSVFHQDAGARRDVLEMRRFLGLCALWVLNWEWGSGGGCLCDGGRDGQRDRVGSGGVMTGCGRR